MSATYDIDTAVGKVRRLIGDMVPSVAKFQDEELEWFLDEEGDNVWLAAADALDALASAEAQKLSSYSRGGISISRQTASALTAQAEKFRAFASAEYAEEITELAYDPFSLDRILTDKALMEEI